MRVAIIVLIVSFLLVLCVPSRTISYVRAETPPPCDVELNTEESITLCIKDLWGSNSDVALAIVMAESRFKLDAVNYNCRYNGKSTFCKKGDLTKAWSVDCSLFQINSIHGKGCDSVKNNILTAKEIFDRDGWSAWSSYNNGSYLKYLPKTDILDAY